MVGITWVGTKQLNHCVRFVLLGAKRTCILKFIYVHIYLPTGFIDICVDKDVDKDDPKFTKQGKK